MRAARAIRTTGIAGLAALTALLAACSATPGGATGSAVPAPSAAQPTVTVTVTAPGTADPPMPSASTTAPSATVAPASCSSLHSVPDGSSTVQAGPDGGYTLFLTASAPYCFGVHTSNSTSAALDPLPGGGTHRVWETATDGATGRAIVLDDGRTALVYRLLDEGIQQLQRSKGARLEFPVGRTAAGGTGVACNDQNGGTLIMGSTLRRRPEGTYDVLWSLISRVSDDGVAQIDAPEVRWSALAAGDPRVAQAATSHCWAAPKAAIVARG